MKMILLHRRVRGCRPFLGFLITLLLVAGWLGPLRGDEIESTLEAIRKKHDLPALACAVIVEGRTAAVRAVGVRKHGGDQPVTRNDRFHIGSCTKAMTATLIARLIERRKIAETITVGEAFADFADTMNPAYKSVTLTQLLAHRAGLPPAAESWPAGMTFVEVHGLPGSPRQQREEYVKRMLSQDPVADPGTKYVYSNAGYSVAAVIAERATDRAWEELMREELFTPLKITTAGFGAMGTPDREDEPWQHRMEAGKKTPIPPGPMSDNPPAIAPAGTVHLSLGDWAKFIQAHLAGARGGRGILKPTTFEKLHTPLFGGDYAAGWIVAERSWGGGRVLTHAGSNNQNYAVVWVAPRRNFAVLAATNQGGGAATQACDDVASAMIAKFLVDQR